MIEQEPQLLVGRIGGERFQIATYASWTEAIAVHTTLSSALRRGLVGIVGPERSHRGVHDIRFVGGSTSMDYLAVRSANDPAWNRAPKLKLAEVEDAKGRLDFRQTLVRLVKQQGLSIHGHEGGWLYTGGPSGRHNADQHGCKLSVYQGWMSWWHHQSYRFAGAIVQSQGRYYLTVQPKPIVTASYELVGGGVVR